MSELKPCPFCGSKDVTKVLEGVRHPMIYVRCNGCLSMSGWYEADEEDIMVSAWNKRVGEQAKVIDVPTLKEWVENWFTKNRQYHPYAKNNNIPITELYDILEQIPTIDPVRKGKWILVKGSNGKDYHKCSECLHTQEITGVKNYCAVCGADMGEGD